jgi:hypothetical protein
MWGLAWVDPTLIWHFKAFVHLAVAVLALSKKKKKLLS